MTGGIIHKKAGMPYNGMKFKRFRTFVWHSQFTSKNIKNELIDGHIPDKPNTINYFTWPHPGSIPSSAPPRILTVISERENAPWVADQVKIIPLIIMQISMDS